MKKKVLSEWLYGIEELKYCIGIISSIEIVRADDAWGVLFAIDVVFVLVEVQLFQIFLLVVGLQVELDIFESVAFDLIVIGQTVYLGRGEVDKEVVIWFDAVFEGWGGHSFALVISTADEAAVDVDVGQTNAAHLFEIEIQKITFYCS